MAYMSSARMLSSYPVIAVFCMFWAQQLLMSLKLQVHYISLHFLCHSYDAVADQPSILCIGSKTRCVPQLFSRRSLCMSSSCDAHVTHGHG